MDVVAPLFMPQIVCLTQRMHIRVLCKKGVHPDEQNRA